ncbi:MAG: hypothetical protein U0414_30390 [Polyangiaceae bacterium]
MLSKKTILRGAATVVASTVLGILVAACGKRGAEGVPECDEYFKTVDTCKNESEKSSLKAEADLSKSAWQYLGQDKVKTACAEANTRVKERCDAGPDGVAECDEYFKLLTTCKNETQKANEKQNRENWKSQTKKTVAGSCKIALDNAKTFCK